MGVVFFPSLPFMGVMLFPSFVLGNVSGEGGAFLVSPSPFYVLRFQHALRVLLRCLPLRGPVVVRAHWLGWILLLFQRLEEYRDCVALRAKESCDPPVFVAHPVGFVSAW